MQTPVQTIDAGALSALSGLTDRRHRQLAKSGFFPPPANGQYELNATIRGLFRYYRESSQKQDELRVQQTRKEKALAIRIETENKVRAGRLIEPEIMREEIARAFSLVRQAILSGQAEVPPRANPQDHATALAAWKTWADRYFKFVRDGLASDKPIDFPPPPAT
jgi:hypothetical protein